MNIFWSFVLIYVHTQVEVIDPVCVCLPEKRTHFISALVINRYF